MVENEPRIILVGEDNGLVELKPSANLGASRLLAGIRATLVAGVESGLLESNPFFVPQPEVALTAQQELVESLSSERASRVEPPKFYPEISLEDELERQRVELVERMAVPLGIDKDQFLAKLPTRFPERGANYDELALNVPLIVPDLTSFGVNWFQMTVSSLFYDPDGLDTVLEPYISSGLKNIEVWQDPRKVVKPFPQVPHAVWVQDGSRYVNRKSRDVRKELKREERAGDQFKGVGLALLRPDMVKTMYWDLIGGILGFDGVPFVDWLGRPLFDCHFVGHANPGFRALVCGSEFSVA
ncbi:hypothetical protein HYS93_05030 [Candidatus Daviesbacteria bacterium]|nr:hypothetical protein [Candidatus Daviesbacteria bacterium]